MNNNVIKIIDLCKNAFGVSAIEKFRVDYNNQLDNIQKGLKDYCNLVDNNEFVPGQLYVCSVPVKELYCDNTYNRGDNLSTTKITQNIKSENGFSYGNSGVLVGFLRNDGKLILTQGNHRASMAYLCLGENARVPVSIIVHMSDEKSYTKIESKNYHVDGTHRYNQNQNQKFKGGLHSGDVEYLFLYNICKEHNIRVYETNKDYNEEFSIIPFDARCSFNSYQYLQRGTKSDTSIDYEMTKDCLRLLSNNLKDGDTDIKGYVYLGLFYFYKQFNCLINDVFKCNPGTSLDKFVNFIFNERRVTTYCTDLTTQSDITKGSKAIKDPRFFASRFVGYFNEYCAANKLKISNGRDSTKYSAITDSSDAWKSLIKNLDQNLHDKAKENAFIK